MAFVGGEGARRSGSSSGSLPAGSRVSKLSQTHLESSRGSQHTEQLVKVLFH